MIFLSNPPLSNETMTSWAWRVFNQNDYPSEWVVLHEAYYSSIESDPDFNFETKFSVELQSIAGLTVHKLRECFSVGGALVLPRLVRSAYCYDCLERSIRQVGLPSWQKSWCSPFLPICQIHERVLFDTNDASGIYYDFPAQAFIQGDQLRRSRFQQNEIKFSASWYGDKYMDAAIRSLRWYTKLLSARLGASEHSVRRLWEIFS